MLSFLKHIRYLTIFNIIIDIVIIGVIFYFILLYLVPLIALDWQDMDVYCMVRQFALQHSGSVHMGNGQVVLTMCCPFDHEPLWWEHVSGKHYGFKISFILIVTLQWRHNERDGVSDHQTHDSLLNRLFRRRSKKTSKLRVTDLCVRNSRVTGEFPTQRASTAENFSIWCRHYDLLLLAWHLIERIMF